MLPRRLVTTALGVALLVAPSAAHAATATTAPDGNLNYVGAPGELNDIGVSRVSGDTFRIVDHGAPIQAAQGCTQEMPNQVSCTTAPGHPIVAHLGDMNDRAFSRTGRGVQFFGEAGNDRLAGASGRDLIDGGDGSDILSGGPGRDLIRGGPGDDQLFGNGGADLLGGEDGMDLLDGGAGNDAESGGAGNDTFRQGPVANGADTLFGGDGVDTADYSLRSAPVRVSIDNQANDGDLRAGEHDDVRSSVETVLGGAGSDQLFGSDRDDTLVGGTGGDVIVGGRGNDRVDGGPGADQIAARDLSVDSIGCGDDSDSVAADPRDAVATDCEHVRRVASMSLRLAAVAFYPTLMLRLRCPLTAFKYCAGKIIVTTTGRVPTRRGAQHLVVAAKRFLLDPFTERVTGVRVRAAAAPFVRRGGLEVRARLSGFDGAGPARPAAIRFKLRRR